MISLIISSYQENYFSALEKNIAETISVSYEIIKIHNPGKMGICEAYNAGAAKSKYNYLLFIHEDILFQTQNWGEILISHLETAQTGVLGLAGSNYVPKAPSAWSIMYPQYTFGNINREDKNEKPKQKAFALDGLFLAVKKTVFQEFLFDENLKLFHGYDTDFSLRVATKYNNFVIGDIFIRHFSKGNPDKVWLDNHIFIRRKIKYKFHKNTDTRVETQMFHAFLKDYFSYYRCNLKNILVTLRFFPNNLTLKNKLAILMDYKFYIFNTSKSNNE